MIANCITVSRILFSLLLFAFSPDSFCFAGLYVLCGVTDVLDGFAARKLHTESEKGAILDSAADLVFAAVYVVRILPRLTVPLWAWIWTGCIAILKVTGILRKSVKAHKLSVAHSFANKLTGLLIFLLPLSVYWVDVRYSLTVVCLAATCAAAEEIASSKKSS